MIKRVLFLAVFILLVAVGFIFLNKSQSKPTYQPQHRNYTLVVKNNKLVEGPSVLSAIQGDTVSIFITADVNGELHLHGYDKHVDFTKGKKDTLTLVANTAGRFPYELEDTKTEIGALEVQPK